MTYRSHRERPWIEVASRPDGFTLVERPTNRATTPWRNLKLKRTNEGPGKRNWSILWNGDRFAQATDAILLAKRSPEVAEWVVEVLMSTHADAADANPKPPAQSTAPKDYRDLVRAADQKMLTEGRSLSDAMFNVDDADYLPPPRCPA